MRPCGQEKEDLGILLGGSTKGSNFWAAGGIRRMVSSVCMEESRAGLPPSLWFYSEVLQGPDPRPPRSKHRVHQHFTPYSSDSRGTNMGSNSPEIVCSLDMFGPSPGPYTNRHGRKGYEGKGDRRTEPISRQPKYRLPNRTGFGGTGRTGQL